MLFLTLFISLIGFTLHPRHSCLGVTEKEVLEELTALKLTQTTEEIYVKPFLKLKLSKDISGCLPPLPKVNEVT